jgi:hypothetical protein
MMLSQFNSFKIDDEFDCMDGMFVKLGFSNNILIIHMSQFRNYNVDMYINTGLEVIA